MTKRKNNKRALIVSMLSLLLCVSMLVGSTMAWFTDNASTAVNTIQSGIIDIRLTDAEGNNMEGKTLNFVNAKGSSDILWEPGCTFVTEPVRLWNYSNLSFALKTSIQGFAGDVKLRDALEIKIVPYDTICDDSGNLKAFAFDDIEESYLKQWSDAYDGFPMQSWQYGLQADWSEDSDGVQTEHPGVGEPKPIEDICIVAHMKEDAGNEYQGLTLTGVGLLFQATQLAEEYDSFDNRYDAQAEYDEVLVVPKNDDIAPAVVQEKLNTGAGDVIDFSGSTIIQKPGTSHALYYTKLPGGNSVIQNLNTNGSLYGLEMHGDITFENCNFVGQYAMNISDGNNAVPGKVTFKNCTIQGWMSFAANRVTSVEFINCKFVAGEHQLFLNSYQDTTFVGCTFDSAFGIDDELAGEQTWTFTNCTGLNDGNINTTGTYKTVSVVVN